jgi:hypothetical protein
MAFFQNTIEMLFLQKDKLKDCFEGIHPSATIFWKD